MAGRARQRALVEQLERMRVEQLEDGTVVDFVVDWTASGKTLTQLVGRINKALGLTEDKELSLGMLTKYVYGLEPEAEKRIAAARRHGAHGLSDQSIDIADGAKDKDEAAAARVQVSSRQWLAERWNREEFGQRNGALVQINVGSLHLDALRKLAIEDGNQAEGDGDGDALARVSSDADRLVSATDGATEPDYEVVSEDKPTS